MTNIQVAALPAGALLESYVRDGAYTDCYSTTLEIEVTLSEFMEAFYTTFVFKSERFILAKAMNLPSTDSEAHEIAHGKARQFSAWKVEDRDVNQVILAAGRTRSWLMVHSEDSPAGEATALYFGSAIVPDNQGGPGWQFKLLLSFHKLYSRILLGAAARRLSKRRQ